MKRIEILKGLQEKPNSINFESVTKRDLATLESLKSKKVLEIITTEESIDQYLENPSLSLDSQFLTLFKTKESLQSEIDLIDKIKNTYL
jgi:hypothetical protein